MAFKPLDRAEIGKMSEVHKKASVGPWKKAMLMQPLVEFAERDADFVVMAQARFQDIVNTILALYTAKDQADVEKSRLDLEIDVLKGELSAANSELEKERSKKQKSKTLVTDLRGKTPALDLKDK